MSRIHASHLIGVEACLRKARDIVFWPNMNAEVHVTKSTRTLLPTATSLLYPNVPENVPEMLKLKRQKATWYFD